MRKLDPRTKLLATVMLIVATFLTEDVKSFVGIITLFVIILLCSKTSPRPFLRNLLLLSWLLVFTFLAHLWGHISLHQEPLSQRFSLGGISITYEGLTGGAHAVGQLIVVVGWVTILGATTSPLEIVTSLERLFRSLRFPGKSVQTLAIITMLSLRFIPILFEEEQHLVRAYIARGVDLRSGSLLTRLKNYVLLSVPLFNSMLRRVEHLTLAMESRAFRAGADRTTLQEFCMKPLDYLLLGGSIGMLSLIWWGI